MEKEESRKLAAIAVGALEDKLGRDIKVIEIAIRQTLWSKL